MDFGCSSAAKPRNARSSRPSAMHSMRPRPQSTPVTSRNTPPHFLMKSTAMSAEGRLRGEGDAPQSRRSRSAGHREDSSQKRRGVRRTGQKSISATDRHGVERPRQGPDKGRRTIDRRRSSRLLHLSPELQQETQSQGARSATSAPDRFLSRRARQCGRRTSVSREATTDSTSGLRGMRQVPHTTGSRFNRCGRGLSSSFEPGRRSNTIPLYPSLATPMIVDLNFGEPPL
jgi:hypothetical protein